MALDHARAATRLAVRRCFGADWGDAVLVACSGGADSLALLAACVFEARKAGVVVIGAVVDHGLQEGSAEHTSRVVAQMASLGVDETASIRVTVDPGPAGIEGGAREARYAALAQLAEHFGASVVLLGHTLDDQAETVLLGLTRGSGGRSLQGMRRLVPVGGPLFFRPFLDLTREQTEAACRADGIEWWSDPHNDDPRFLRSRVRHEVMPMLERELGPGSPRRWPGRASSCAGTWSSSSRSSARRTRGHGCPTASTWTRSTTRARRCRSRCVRRAAIDAGAIASELTLRPRPRRPRPPRHPWQKEVQLPGHVTAYADPPRILRFRRTDPGSPGRKRRYRPVKVLSLDYRIEERVRVGEEGEGGLAGGGAVGGGAFERAGDRVEHHLVDGVRRGELAHLLGGRRRVADDPARQHRLGQVAVLGRQRVGECLLDEQLGVQRGAGAQRHHGVQVGQHQPVGLLLGRARRPR